ncbi:MAG: ribosome maturation factor RimP [Candidatus Omnitrophota bacterium]|nr:MAG: ribosome maturation factor RimP [Candidatus Omnitrophota bacterium]RKY35662.1 MAG: ribosome maturation factor RimP [Candidatus Omnitrophota bacterium]RKY43718.1 MAG: ribosome maturation factor RimP [Candidatus Omnitrophota bacterium]
MNSLQEKQAFLRKKITPLVEKEGFEVFELKLFYNKGRLFLRILIDFKEGGITLEDCQYINKKLSDYLDKEDFLESPFILEVSSPGIKRELKTLKDFLRVRGREINVWFQGQDFKKPIQGKVSGIDVFKGEVLLETREGNLPIPLVKIRKATQRVNYRSNSEEE